MAIQDTYPSSSKSHSPRTYFLLDLPGEIRNRIYYFAFEKSVIIFTPRRTKEAIEKPPKNDPFWPTFPERYGQHLFTTSELLPPSMTKETDDERRKTKSIREFRSLTQVCRTIRNEYLPLYKKLVTYRIFHVDLQNYLDTVLLPECLQNGKQLMQIPSDDCINTREYYDEVSRQAFTQHRYIARNLLIDCNSWEERDGDLLGVRHDLAIDLLPFLKFCATAPGVRVQCGRSPCQCCEDNWAGIKALLNALFDINRRPKLKAWLEKSVDAVELTWPPYLLFDMKKGHGKTWSGDGYAYNGTESPEMKKWTNEVGLSLDWKTYGYLGFFCAKSDWGLDGCIEERDEESAEDKEFWEQVRNRNGERKRKIRRKRRCGMNKLERIGRGNGRWR